MADSETGPVFCDVWAALEWIAFRGVPPPDDEWWDASQPGQCPEIKAALRARIAGSPRLWRGLGREPETWRYRAAMRRWMRGKNPPASAKTAAALLADIEKCDRDNAWGTAFGDKIQAQLPELNRAVSEGRLQAEGRPTTNPRLKPGDRPRVPIPPNHVDEKRQIDATGAIHLSGEWWFLERDLGPCYYDVRFKALDVRACWKPSSSVASRMRAEGSLAGWLADQMRAAPDTPRPKTTMQEEAKQAGHIFGPTAFKTAWTKATSTANVPAWRTGGRRKSS